MKALFIFLSFSCLFAPFIEHNLAVDIGWQIFNSNDEALQYIFW